MAPRFFLISQNTTLAYSNLPPVTRSESQRCRRICSKVPFPLLVYYSKAPSALQLVSRGSFVTQSLFRRAGSVPSRSIPHLLRFCRAPPSSSPFHCAPPSSASPSSAPNPSPSYAATSLHCNHKTATSPSYYARSKTTEGVVCLVDVCK
ncbi:uncharacterized protein DS421_7g218570 [Arachis hypogaea]|nr:uncharacterized protein DS421_7g218570 [Arachis hypogaea]